MELIQQSPYSLFAIALFYEFSKACGQTSKFSLLVKFHSYQLWGHQPNVGCSHFLPSSYRNIHFPCSSFFQLFGSFSKPAAFCASIQTKQRAYVRRTTTYIGADGVTYKWSRFTASDLPLSSRVTRNSKLPPGKPAKLRDPSSGGSLG